MVDYQHSPGKALTEATKQCTIPNYDSQISEYVYHFGNKLDITTLDEDAKANLHRPPCQRTDVVPEIQEPTNENLEQTGQRSNLIQSKLKALNVTAFSNLKYKLNVRIEKIYSDV